MKKLVLLLCSVFTVTVFSNGVEVLVSPQEPVKGEVFDVRFKVTMTGSEKPFISFTPVNLEVLERVSEPEYHFEIRGGIGRAKTTKTLTYTYRMVANRGGTSYLKNIVVELGKEKLKHKNINIKILSKRKELPRIFARAEVSKDSVYLGEGVDVRYYIYSLFPVLQTEIKTFPKLNGFIKRFHKTLDSEEAVRVDGKVYRRSLKYSARVYPEKTGELTIDPLRMVVQYAGGSMNPFGNMGFGFNRFKKKSLSSKRVKIAVKPLPTEGLPSNFTGLVGEHEFKLVMTKNRFLVNEAVEARLEVSGPGALEKLEAPRVYQSEALEKFDDKSDFQEVGTSDGRKVFEYTYLARANIEIPERTLSLGYFDPESETYKIKDIEIPALKIGGALASQQIMPTKESKKEDTGNLKDDRVFREVPAVSMMSAPLFDTSWKSIPLNWIKYLNISLLVIVILQFAGMVYRSARGERPSSELSRLYKTILKNGCSYQSLVTLIFMLGAENSDGNDIFKVIDRSDLKKADKEYLSGIVRELEAESYSKNKLKVKKKIKTSALKNLKKEIEKRIGNHIVGDSVDEGLKLDSRTS